MSAQRTIRMSLAVVASAASLMLSWPYWRDFEYWAESRIMWLVYFVLGFVIAVYVFHAFLDSLSILFEHDALERDRQKQTASSGEVSVRMEDQSRRRPETGRIELPAGGISARMEDAS